METVVIDCRNVANEADFWRLYLEVVKPEGAQFFGGNTAAFWDAVSAGGPGWPGDVELLFTNAKTLSGIDNGHLLHRLQEIAESVQHIRVCLNNAT